MNNSVDLIGPGVKFLDREQLVGLAARSLGSQHNVLLICDLAADKSEKSIIEYTKALEKAGILDSENSAGIQTPELQLVVVPFNSLPMAEEAYRGIPHASHFVTLWVDGQPFAGAC